MIRRLIALAVLEMSILTACWMAGISVGWALAAHAASSTP